jgi:hypothetical protein
LAYTRKKERERKQKRRAQLSEQKNLSTVVTISFEDDADAVSMFGGRVETSREIAECFISEPGGF